MKWFLILTLICSIAFASHEKSVRTKADFFATARFTSQRYHSWPFALQSIGHNMQSYQNYGGSPYWHDGLDIRSLEGQPIYASVGGKVVNIENYVSGNELYWEVAILDSEGFVWKYHHVDRSTIPQDIFSAYKTGKPIEVGTLLGHVVSWPVSSFGEVYHHLHLLIVGADGKYINPFLMMEPLTDTVSPEIKRIGISKNHKPTDLAKVSGQHGLFIEANDLVLHKKFILPPHKITYRLDQGEEKLVWEFVHLPSGTNDTDYINDFYLLGTCGNYSCRQFYINLNFSPAQPRAQFNLAKGQHEVEVTVSDVLGNEDTKAFVWEVY